MLSFDQTSTANTAQDDALSRPSISNITYSILPNDISLYFEVDHSADSHLPAATSDLIRSLTSIPNGQTLTSPSVSYHTMRLSWAAVLLAYHTLVQASSVAQQPLQVFLHPSPPPSSLVVPTLNAVQAKAVLAHHLGETIGNFEEIPQDEGLWSHFLRQWNDSHGKTRSRIVIIDGGVTAEGMSLSYTLRLIFAPRRSARYNGNDSCFLYISSWYRRLVGSLPQASIEAVPTHPRIRSGCLQEVNRYIGSSQQPYVLPLGIESAH